MEKSVLFCKSYDRDMFRARRMAESVMRFNRDNLALYISVPENDLDSFKKCFGDLPCIFVTDEAILKKSAQFNGPLPGLYPPHLLQQLVKLEFWRLGFCKNYIWIDSDSYFIKDFKEKTFFFDEHTPFIFQSEYNKKTELKRMSHVPKKIREKRVRENVELISRFQKLFKNSGVLLNFSGSMPIAWSVKVLQSFNDEFLKKIGKNIYEILYEFPSELQLYGEYLYSSKIIPIHPKHFLFKSFLYADDFYISQMQGEYEYSIAKDFYGICMQSNWALIRHKKKNSERLKRNVKELLASLGFLCFKKRK